MLAFVDLFIGLVALFFYFYYFILKFYLFIYLFIFLSFFLPFLLSLGADRVLVLWPGVRLEPLRWESQVQDIGTPENYQPHVISIGESSPRNLHLNTKTQIHPTGSKLQCWMPHAKEQARQEHKTTH